MKFSVLVAVIVAVLLLVQPSLAAIKCSDVISDLSPCLSYIVNGNGKPTPACCKGVSKLSVVASTTADRRTACSCLVSAGQRLKVNQAAASALPGSCGITLSFTIGPNVDCSKIS